MPTVHVIGGPNGAGKSSLAQQLLPAALLRRFVNADDIAAGLASSRAGAAAARVRAGRLMLRQIRAHAAAGERFAFETTLASRMFIKFLRELKRDGYQIHLTYIYLNSAALAQRRVQGRVSCGGHDIPRADIERRYRRSVANFRAAYRALADQWRVYDNSAVLRLVARAAGAGITVIDNNTWQQISPTNS